VDVPPAWSPEATDAAPVQEQSLCEVCAQGVGVAGVSAKPAMTAISKMLRKAQRTRKFPTCPGCQMSLLEFRQRGRLGCPECYKAFREQLHELLERVHGSTRHVGRVPGLDAEALEMLEQRSQLERELEHAIREEAYEQAAKLRDKLKSLRGD
jgi:protein arginine kinase activator